MNVLIYSDSRLSSVSVEKTISFFKKHIGDSYTVVRVGSKALAEDPWQASTSLLVFPGGDDLVYLQLSGRANSNIIDYVARGGRYIGFGTGSYYASRRCEFEPGTDEEVVGDRPLGFFPGVCRGSAFKNIDHDSKTCAIASPLTFNLPSDAPNNISEEKCHVFYNGGGSFIDTNKYNNTKVLAVYDKPTESGSQIAAVLCSVGDCGGQALLSAVHPEYEEYSEVPTIHQELLPYKQKISDIFRVWLQLLGLKLNQEVAEAPKLTNIHIVYPESENSEFVKWSPGAPSSVESLFQRLKAQSNPGSGLLEDSNDIFKLQLLEKEQTCDVTTLHDPQPEESSGLLALIGCSQPSKVIGGTFHPELYFKTLRNLSLNSPAFNVLEVPFFGAPLMYSEIVGSTQVILQKNPKFLQTLPNGTVIVACRQVTGKGRGRNSWVSPLGCLQFSFHFLHPKQNLNPETTSVVLIQFLAALAVVEGIRLQPGYEELDLCLKWPNDIYGLDYRTLDSNGKPLKRKIGGVLVYFSLKEQYYSLIVGIGVNTTNSTPTMCINDLIDQLNQRRFQQTNNHDNSTKLPLQHLTQEEYLALILNRFRSIYAQFMKKSQGLTPFLDQYYSYWLHSQQLVTLNDQGGMKARVLGITPDYGLLEVLTEEAYTGQIGPLTCQRMVLQPDGNSFDMMTGFISRKVYS